MGDVPVQKLTPERRRQMTRDALLDAAADAFAKRGFHGASLDEIAESAGFTRGAIYKNFTGKEELFLEVMQRFNERFLAEYRDLLRGQAFDAIDVGAVAKKWREALTADPNFIALELEFNLYVLRNPEVRSLVLAKRRQNWQMVTEFMGDQAEATAYDLPIPVEDLAAMFLSASDGFAIASAFEPRNAELWEPFMELLMAGLLAGPPSYYKKSKS
jgi:AcrR family transcriptional regulator